MLSICLRSTRSSIFMPLFLLSTIATIISGVKVQFDSAASTSGKLPIILPKAIGQPTKEGKYEIEIADPAKDPCLLYVESVSVVLFNFKASPKKSAWANMNTNTSTGYSGSMECPQSQNIGTTFSVDLTVNADGVPGYYRGDKGKDVVFKASKVDVRLTFNYTQPGYWRMVDAEAKEIQLANGAETNLPQIGSSSKLVSGMSVGGKGWMHAENHAPAWNINGFKDYAFTCTTTNPIVWANDGNTDFAVGISLHNVQIQLNATYYDKDKSKSYAKFGYKVNDCEPLFSIGTWMGLIVALLLIGVLSFGFLMLNSVQTMDRFDDPKQKQLIISAKE